MAIEIIIRPKRFKKNIKLLELLSLLEPTHGIGTPSLHFTLENVQGNSPDSEKQLLIFDRKNIGRGFGVILEKDYIKMTLSAGASISDITIFYDYLDKISAKLQANTFDQNGKTYNFEERDMIIEKTKLFIVNNLNVKIIEKKKNCILGALLPIVLEDGFIEELAKVPINEQLSLYSKYINDKQQIQAYYVKPVLYQDQQDNRRAWGLYVISENVLSIFPIKPRDPFFTEGHKLKDHIINIIYDQKKDNTYKELYIDFADFVNNIDLNSYEKFDQNNILIKLKRQDIKPLIPFNIEIEEMS